MKILEESSSAIACLDAEAEGKKHKEAWKILKPDYSIKPCRTPVAPLAGFTAWMNDDHLGLSLFYSGQFNSKYQDQQVNMQLEYAGRNPSPLRND